jgi:hypothetical protein
VLFPAGITLLPIPFARRRLIRIAIYQIGAIRERGKPRPRVVNKVKVVASGRVEHVDPLYCYNIPAKEGLRAGRECWWDLCLFHHILIRRIQPSLALKYLIVFW